MAVPDILSALSDGTRRRILVKVSEGEATVGEIARDMPISQPAISQQLKVLRDAGLLRMRPNRQKRLYSLNAEPLADVGLWMLKLAGFWSQPAEAIEERLRDSLAEPE